MKLALKILAAITLFALLGWLNFAMKTPQQAIAEAEINSTAVNPAMDPAINQTDREQDVTQNMAQDMMRSQTVTDFTNVDDERDRWRSVNDNVMGGISQGAIAITEGTGVFKGELSLENNGGFSSVRRTSGDYDFSAASGLSLRVKGDGRRYQLRVQTTDADSISYRAEFETTAGEWQTLQVSFADFEPVFRGRTVADAPTLNPAAITQVGFLIAAKRSGEFSLEIDWIHADL